MLESPTLGLPSELYPWWLCGCRNITWSSDVVACLIVCTTPKLELFKNHSPRDDAQLCSQLLLGLEQVISHLKLYFHFCAVFLKRTYDKVLYEIQLVATS